jgi:hypothetical protein
MKRIIRKTLFAITLIMATGVCANAQEANKLNVFENSGNVSQYELSDIKFITFDNNINNMIVEKTDNSQNSFLIASIRKITFEDYSVGIKENKTEIDVIVYADQNGEIVVQTELKIKAVTIYDLNGRALQKKSVNSSSCRMNVNSLSSAMYLLKVETEKGAVTKKVIIN